MRFILGWQKVFKRDFLRQGDNRTSKFLPAGCREAANCYHYAAGIKFTHRPKIRFFAPHGRLVAPIHVKLGRADGYIGPLGCTKFHLNRHKRVGMRPQNIKKIPLFGKESPAQWRLPWPISKIFRSFYTPNYPTLLFQISYDSNHRLRSYCWETAHPSIWSTASPFVTLTGRFL